jgi:preprotein translocase SecE subunit
MATAVQPKTPSTPPAPQAAPASALLTGALGAAVMVVGVAVAAYAVPLLWAQAVSPVLAPMGGIADALARFAVQVVVLFGFARLGGLLMGPNPPRGTRGAIGLILSLAIALCFIVNAVGQNLQDAQYGSVITLVVLGALLGGSFRLLTSEFGRGVMLATDEQGWFSLFAYKPAQGLKARRYTLIGLVVIGWTGIYSLMNHTLLSGDWVWYLPFTGTPGTPTTAETRTAITLLTDIGYTIPLLLGVAVFWLAWRAINAPQFADFLIATEVEMNKVSWSSRKQLVQDTIVVLIFVILMTLFLMVVDFFWGWLLSQKIIGVLPPRDVDPTVRPLDATGTGKVEW